MKYRNLLLGTALLASFASCKKDLDLLPTDLVTENNAFISVNDLQLATNVAYNRYGWTSAMYVSALASDEVRFGANNSGAGQFVYRLQYSADGTSGGDVIGAWGNMYSMIDQCNRIIPNIDRVPAANAFETGRKSIIRANLLALRATGHFELLRWYARPFTANDPLGVPVMTTSSLDGQPARNTVGETLAAIEADYAQALSLLPAVTPATFSDTVLNQINVKGLQARVALYKGEWQRAADLANEVINSNVRPLQTGTNFTNIWNDQNTTGEVLYRIRYNTSTAAGAMWTGTDGTLQFQPSNKLLDTYGTNDVRLTAYIGTGSAANGVATGQRFVNKFFISARGGRVVDAKCMRIAEMYLIRAEALAELNNLTGAADAINTLRAARITGYTPVTFASRQAAIDEIMLERYKELAFEGFRFFDLKRKGLPVARDARDVDGGANSNWLSLPVGNFRFTFPIPASELLANRNMVQNAGY
ncbi:MAG TPA: hypothetical protein DCL43_09005 [Chitinophagaceae bacterium]|nr:hypothetical protein [Chitinophagaceae bacterium]HAN37908.1 hypothetical protein [Chitinophagaceae bacterium]